MNKIVPEIRRGFGWRKIARLGGFFFCVCISSIQALGQTGSPVIISASDFVLTEAQAAAGIDGRVKISLQVNKKGLVEDAEVIAGPMYPCKAKPKDLLEEFKTAVKKNARTFRFEPAMKGGRLTSSVVVLTVTVGGAYKRSLKEGQAKKLVETGGLLGDRLVDVEIVTGRAKKLPTPRFPTATAISGYSLPQSVIVDIIIDKDGTVLAAGATSGQKEFQEVARDAACAAQFTPTLLQGTPVKVVGIITIETTIRILP